MSSGTITLTHGDTAVTGVDTSFTKELKEGDFIVTVVGGVTYTLPVNAVDGDTQLTLLKAYDGPTQEAAAWNGVPRETMNAITAQLAAELTEAMRGLNLDKRNWQDVFSDKADITVTLPDSSRFSGPAWGYLAKQAGDLSAQLAGKVDKAQNLNDLADKSAAWATLLKACSPQQAWADLQLKGLAVQDVIDRTDLNAELQRGLFAAGWTPVNSAGAGIWSFTSKPFGLSQYGTCIQVSNRTDAGDTAGPSVWQHYLALGADGEILYAYNINGIYSSRKLYTTGNTTTNSSGALVPASPVVRVVNSRKNCRRADIAGVGNAEYQWNGDNGLFNEEAEGCTVRRTGTGTYLISGAAGLAKDLWQVMDCGNGQGRIIALAQAEETAEGIIVRCYQQKWQLSEDGRLTVEKGEITDIPDDSWIDVRLQMPPDSVYNRKRAMAESH